MKKTQNLLDLIGNTSLFEVEKNIFVKLENQNPGGSIKDRAAVAMISAAEKSGALIPEGTIVEATSGNLGISLAWIGAVKKYKIQIVLPENFSLERRKIITQFGAKVILTSAAEGMRGAIQEADKIAAKLDAWQPRQFENSANPEVHRKTTANEIWEQAEGAIDFFVAGVGTGGTITGVGEVLKSLNSKIQICAVEPAESPVISGGIPGVHEIEGIGAGFIPKNLNTAIIDDILQVDSDDAFTVSQMIARDYGILVGISSGANLIAAKILAKKNPDKKIITVFPDSGERYLSTGLFESLT